MVCLYVRSCRPGNPGEVGLALIVGSSNLITPQAMLPAMVPAFVYIVFWFAIAGLAYGLIGIETKGCSYEEIDGLLGTRPAVKASSP